MVITGDVDEMTVLDAMDESVHVVDAAQSGTMRDEKCGDISGYVPLFFFEEADGLETVCSRRHVWRCWRDALGVRRPSGNDDLH